MSDPIEALCSAGGGKFACPSCGALCWDGNGVGYPFCPRGCSADRMRAALIEEPRCEEDHGSYGNPMSKCVPCQTEIEIARAKARRRAALADGDDGGSWAPQSLVEVEPVPPPTILEIAPGDFLLRCGWVHLVHGAFGSAKTPLCYIAVVEAVRAGNLALIVDYEMGKSGAKAQLIELGLTEEQIDAGVYFCDQPGPMTAAAQRRIVAEVEKRGQELTVAVVDSLSESMATVAGSSDNDSLDVASWASELPGWIAKKFDAAVLVIDHSGVEDGPRPSGSHKKREVVQFHLWCRKDTPFSRANPEAGKSTLLVMKDRSGDREIKKAVAEIRTRPGGSFYLAPVEGTTADEVEIPGELQPENSTDEEVFEIVKASGETGSMKKEITGSGAQGTYRRAALDRLVAVGRLTVRPDGRGGRGSRYWVTELGPP